MDDGILTFVLMHWKGWKLSDRLEVGAALHPYTFNRIHRRFLQLCHLHQYGQ